MTPKAASAKGRKASSLFKESQVFSSFSVKDLKKAKDFYGETLGLEVSETPEGLELDLDGSTVFLYPKENHTPASFTVLNFQIDDIDEAVDELTSLGIRMEKYDQPNLKTDDRGIMRGNGPTIAWFKDPFGNVLSVIEEK